MSLRSLRPAVGIVLLQLVSLVPIAMACALHGSAPLPLPAEVNIREGERDDGARASGWTGSVHVTGAAGSTRFGTSATGGAVLRERTWMLHGAVFPWPTVGLGASVPVVARRIELPDESRQSLRGIGDVGVEVRWRPFARVAQSGPSLEWMAGALLPTAPLAREDGVHFHPDVQLGAGVIVPRIGLQVTSPLSPSLRLLAGSDALWAPRSPDGVQRAATVRLHPGIAWSVAPPLTLQLAGPLRHEGRTRADGEVLTGSGGTVLGLEPRVRWHVGQGLHLEAAALLPLWQGLRGGQRDGVSATAGAGWRF
ncbi:MAG: hypothetical protein EA398_02390 [Deltaproteobacteria bacterium]|nr:MAG: hypothetical protein EA398_02390 [Deltaproteobacteria bacterium]